MLFEKDKKITKNIARLTGEILIPTKRFNKILESEYRERTKKYKNKEFIPAELVILCSDEGINRVTLPLDFSDRGITEDRAIVLKEMGIAIKEENLHVLAIFMFSEAWVSEQSLVKPSEDINRKEMFIGAGLTIDIRSSIIMSELEKEEEIIRRFKDEKFAKFEDGRTQIESSVLLGFYSGYFSSMLNKE